MQLNKTLALTPAPPEGERARVGKEANYPCGCKVLAGTMQLLWGARASRPLFSASRRRPLLPRDDTPSAELRGALGQSAGRRLERPGRSRSPIST